MKPIFKIFFLFFICIVPQYIGAQTSWTDQVYKANVAKIEYNPMKGLIPGYKPVVSNFPYSIDHFYMRWDAVYKNWGQCDWTAFENELKRIVSGGRHSVCRFWIDYPGQTEAMPAFLDTLVSWHDSNSPDWNDSDLMAAFEDFAALFGAKYNGDPRLAMVEVGLYGYWGEWHNYPENWDLTSANKDRLLAAFTAAFPNTHTSIREPNHLSTVPLRMSTGYYDDSFCQSTAGPTSWHFWPKMIANGSADNYKYHPLGGEIYPELQTTLFNAWPNTSGQDITNCVTLTHASFTKCYYIFKAQRSSTQNANALKMHNMMGYQFYVRSVKITGEASNDFTAEIKIQNKGVAPFYYNWDVEFASISSAGVFNSLGSTNWDITTILPDATDYSKSFSANLSAEGTYKILMRYKNPLEAITSNAMKLRFANAKQDLDKDGWLTLGTVSVGGASVPVEGVSISPSILPLTVGNNSQLSANVIPDNATNKTVTFSSDNTVIATVSESGLVTAVAAGNATITVTTQDGGKTATSSVSVTPVNIPVTGVEISPEPFLLAIGNTYQLTAAILPENASNKSVSWFSDNTAIATVSESGLVTAVAAGNASITVTTTDQGKTDNWAASVVDSSLGNGLLAENSIELYPNPVSKTLYFKSPEKEDVTEIKIFTVAGQLLFNEKTNNSSSEIDMEALKTKGLVIVQIFTKQNVFSFKVEVR